MRLRFYSIVNTGSNSSVSFYGAFVFVFWPVLISRNRILIRIFLPSNNNCDTNLDEMAETFKFADKVEEFLAEVLL